MGDSSLCVAAVPDHYVAPRGQSRGGKIVLGHAFKNKLKLNEYPVYFARSAKAVDQTETGASQQQQQLQQQDSVAIAPDGLPYLPRTHLGTPETPKRVIQERGDDVSVDMWVKFLHGLGFADIGASAAENVAVEYTMDEFWTEELVGDMDGYLDLLWTKDKKFKAQLDRHKRIFVVTSIGYAKGLSYKIVDTKKQGAHAGGEMKVDEGTSAGGKGNKEKRTIGERSGKFEGETVFAYRVLRAWEKGVFKKTLETSTETKGALLADDDAGVSRRLVGDEEGFVVDREDGFSFVFKEH